MITLTSNDVKKRKAQTPGTRFLCRNRGREMIEAPGVVLWGNRGIAAAGLYGEHL